MSNRLIVTICTAAFIFIGVSQTIVIVLFRVLDIGFRCFYSHLDLPMSRHLFGDGNKLSPTGYLDFEAICPFEFF